MNQESVPVLVMGETRRKALVAQLTLRTQSWLKDWVAGGAIDVAVELTDEVKAIEPGLNCDRCTIATASGVAHLAVAASGDLWCSVSGATGRASYLTAGNGAITGRVYKQMLQALAEALTSGSRMKGWQYDVVDPRGAVPQARFSGPGWHSAKIEVGAKRDCLSVLISSALILQLAPREVKSATGVTRRRSAVANESIRVEAVLGEASVSIGDLATLAVNDVIMLRDDVPNVCFLQTEKGNPVANISLGRLGTKRAALIVSNRT